MQYRSTRGRIAAVAVVLVALPSVARAQLGSGWSEYNPPHSLQIRGCAAHDAAGGVDRFRITCDSMSGDNRAEQRTQNDYSSGTNQFQGEVRVTNVGANIIVKQTFMPNRGAFFMLAASADGRLYLHGGGGNVASNVFGRWIRINTIHDVSAGTIRVYADGVLSTTKTGGQQVAWHDKFGSYRSQSGRGPALVEWRNVHYYRGGRAPAGDQPTPPPPPADGGVRDARSGDGGGAPDVVGGDMAGTGGTGGAGGTSGAGGSAAGGSGATGGSTGGSGGASAGGTGGAATGGAGGSATAGTAGGTAGTSGGTSGGGAGRGGSGSAGRGGTSGGATNPDPAGGGDPPAGCGCRIGTASDGSWGPMLVLAGVAPLIVRRRRRRPGA